MGWRRPDFFVYLQAGPADAPKGDVGGGSVLGVPGFDSIDL